MKMQTVDSIFRGIHRILGIDVGTVHQTTIAVASTLASNREVATWLSALRGSDLQIPWSAEELRLYGNKASLEEGQIGSRIDKAGKCLPSWPHNWVVLGEISGDPIIGRVEGDCCAVLFARHGSGSWQANLVSEDTAKFATVLRIWCDLFITRYSKNIYDGTRAVRSDFLTELRQRANQSLSDAETDVFMSMVDD